MEKFLRVDCDYAADGLWTPRGSSIDADDVPISKFLRERLRAWQAWHDVANKPWTSDCNYDDELHRLTAIDIARCLKRELPDWTIVAIDRLVLDDGPLGRRVPFPGEHLIPSDSFLSPTQSLTHIALIVRDYDEAIAWFTGMLGFTLVEDSYQPEQDKRWVVVAPPGAGENGASILLARAATPEQARFIGNQAGGRVFLFLRTDDFDRDYAAYLVAGVRFVREPTTRPYGKAAVFEDLYGNRWDLIGPG